MKLHKGFTVVELMVAMLVLAIIVAFAAPSFDGLQRRISIDSNTTRFTSSLNLARSEAVTRASVVTMCRSENADEVDADCSNAGDDWSGGWIVFQDLNGNAVFEEAGDVNVLCEPNVDDCLIRVWADGLSQNGTLIEQSAPSLTSISFDREGYLDDTTTREFHLEMQGCGVDEQQIITVRPLGRVELTRGDC
jgi:type IV fimbrial biogenesis protein FimT